MIQDCYTIHQSKYKFFLEGGSTILSLKLSLQLLLFYIFKNNQVYEKTRQDEESWDTRGQEKQQSVGTDTQRIKIVELLDADFNITLLNLFMEIKDNFRWELETIKNVKRIENTEEYINWNQELNEGLNFN